MSISSPTSVSVIRRSIPGLCGISVTTTSASRTLSCCGRSASIARAVSSVSSRITTWSPSTHDVTASRLMPLSASVFATMLNVPMAFGIRRTISLPDRAVSMTGAPFLLSGQTRAIGEIMLQAVVGIPLHVLCSTARFDFITAVLLVLLPVLAEHVKKRAPPRREPGLQAGGAVARLAGPRLLAREIPAALAVVRVLHLDELEVRLPVRALFFKRRGAETRLHPLHLLLVEGPGLLHAGDKVVLRDRSAAE